ncbi:ATP-binding protein [Fretibacter rubidus]|uniref:sensor histidine kinase n=1 Tax=Fretibacter rubidus TaxID=570162 RepID=UPI00352BC249
MIKRSIFGRMIALFTLMPLITLLCVGLWSAWSLQHDLRQEQIYQINDDIAALTEGYIAGGPATVTAAIEARQSLTPLNRAGAHYGFFNADGERIAGLINIEVARNLDVTRPRSVTLETPDGVVPATVRLTQLRGGERLIVARESGAIKQSLKALLWRFLVAGLLLISLSYIAARFVIAALRRRVDMMNVTLQNVANGQIDARLPCDTAGDEVSFLGSQINYTLSRLERVLSLRKRVTDQLAHEMRSPLTRLDASLLKLDNDPIVDTARQEIKHCVTMLDGLLDISALDAQFGDRRGFQRLDIYALAASLVELFEPLADVQSRPLSLIEAAPIWVEGDPAQLGRLLSNLIDNAFKYGDPSTPITLSVLDTDPNFKGHVVLRVSNTGPLIDEAAMRDIFTPFFRHLSIKAHEDTSDAEPKSFGLGLALSRSIAARHGGTLNVERHPKQTVFRLTLPLIL